MEKDFTLTMYARILAALNESGFKFATISTHSESIQKSRQPVVSIRHDVDRLPERALAMAKLEAEKHIRATYYFRMKPCSYHPDIIQSIASLGHETGFHYETLCDTRGDLEKGWMLFKEQLATLRKTTEVHSISMHGRPFSRWDSTLLWEHFDYRDEGIKLDASLDINWEENGYFTDVGRCWNSTNNLRDYPLNNASYVDQNHISTSMQLIEYIQAHHAARNKKGIKQHLILNIHPERWSKNSLEWVHDSLKDWSINQAKTLLRMLRRIRH